LNLFVYIGALDPTPSIPLGGWGSKRERNSNLKSLTIWSETAKCRLLTDTKVDQIMANALIIISRRD